MTGSWRSASASAWLPRLFAVAFALQAVGCVQKLDPLAIKEVDPGKPATLDPTLAAAGGNLNLARDGKTRIPYVTGLDGGCVAAAVLLWLPLDILLGGTMGGGPDCNEYLPTLTLIQLESRHAAVLQVQKYGDFVVQLPAGTYLVAQVIDNKSLVPMRFGFQISKAGQAYDLGVIALEYGSQPHVSVTAHSDGAFSQLMTRLPGVASWPKSAALLTQISSAPDSQSAAVYFLDKKSLDSYLTATANELKDHGMPLLSSRSVPSDVPPASAAAPQTASADTQTKGTPITSVVRSGPVDVPFKIDYGSGVAESVAKLENGDLMGQASNGGRSITVKGTLKDGKLSLEVDGAIKSPALTASSNAGYYCSGNVEMDNAAGNVTIPFSATCGTDSYLDTIYLELPPAS